MSEVTMAIDTPRGVLLGTVRVTLRTGGLAATHLINAATTGQILRTAPARRYRGRTDTAGGGGEHERQVTAFPEGDRWERNGIGV